jgi:hypothetical protein
MIKNKTNVYSKCMWQEDKTNFAQLGAFQVIRVKLVLL